MAKTVIIKVDVDSGKAVAEVSDVKNALEDIGEGAEKGASKASGSFDGFKNSLMATVDVAQLAGQAARFLFDQFQAGVGEITETEEAFRRLSTVAEQTGQSFESLNSIAEEFSQDGLVSMDEAMQQVADLAKTGFDDSQIKQLLVSFKDLAATAGGDISENISKLTEGLAKNKIGAEEAAKMLPSLKMNLEAAGLSMNDLNDETKNAQVQQVIFNTALQDGAAAAGNAEAALGTLSGQMQVMENLTADLQEGFATAFIENMGLGSTKVGEMSQQTQQLKQTVEMAGQGFGLLAQGIMMAVGALQKYYQILGATIASMADFFGGGVELEQQNKKVIDTWAKSVDVSKLSAEQLERYNQVLKLNGGEIIKNAEATKKKTEAVTKDIFETEASAQSLKNASDNEKKLAEQKKKTEEAIKKSEAAAKAEAAAFEQLKNRFAETLDPTAKLEAEMQKLFDAGATMDQLLKVYGDDVAKVAASHGDLIGTTTPLIAAINQYNKELKALDDQRAKDVEASKKAIEQNNLLVAAQDKLNEAMKSADFDTVMAAVMKYGDGVEAINPALQEEYDALLKVRDALIDKGAADAEGAIKAEDHKRKIEDQQAALERLRAAMDNFASGMAALGDAIGGAFGDLFKTIGELPRQVEGIWSSMKSGWSDLKGVFSGGFDFTGLLSGIGSITGAIGSAIQIGTQLFGVLKEIFGHDWEEDTQEQLGFLLDGLQVSDELAKQIAEDAEEMGNAMAAALVNLPAIFDELGVSQENFMQLAQATQDVFSGVEQGIISAAQANEILAATFPQLLEAAMQFGDEYMDRLEELVDIAAATGIGVETMMQQIADAQAKIAQQVIEQAQIVSDSLQPIIGDLQARWDAYQQTMLETGMANQLTIQAMKDDAMGLASQLLASIDAMKQAGLSVPEIMANVGPTFDSLKTLLKDLGLTMGDVGLGWLNQQNNINKKHAETLTVLGAITNNLQAMDALGIKPTQQAFTAMQNTAVAGLDKIRGAGGASRAELATMLPTLQAMQAASEKYGFSLDPTIEKYIRMAKEQGVWKESDPAPTLEQSMGNLVTVLEKLNTLLTTLAGSAGAYADEMNSVPSEVTTVVTTEYRTEGAPPAGGQPARGARQEQAYQALREPVRFRGRQNIQVDDDEVLLPARFYNANRGLAGIGNQVVNLKVEVNVDRLDYSEVGPLAEQIGYTVQRKINNKELILDNSPDTF